MEGQHEFFRVVAMAKEVVGMDETIRRQQSTIADLGLAYVTSVLQPEKVTAEERIHVRNGILMGTILFTFSDGYVVTFVNGRLLNEYTWPELIAELLEPF